MTTKFANRATAIELLQQLLGLLRAQYWNYQESHWQVKGASFYGDHLLFQRLYESVVEQTDVLAEKMVGKYGPETVSLRAIASKFAPFLHRWESARCPHKRGLLSEADFQAVVKKVYEQLKAMDELSLGMDDFLMAMASDHETNQYLLRQVLRGRG